MENFLNINKIHLRITTNNPMDQIIEIVSGFSNTYLISQEDPGVHQHYHILMEYQTNDNHNKLRYALKKSGYGGVGKYSISQVRSKANLMKYLLKDGGLYVSQNIPESVITLMKKCAFKKSSKGAYSRDLLNLEQKYLGKEIVFRQFEKEYIKLKVSYNQNLYPSHIKGYLYLIQAKNDPEYIDVYLTNQIHDYN